MTMGDRIKRGAKITMNPPKEPTGTGPGQSSGKVDGPDDQTRPDAEPTRVPAREGFGS